MEKDIEPLDNVDINLSEIGKYGKFINFVKIPKEYNTVLFPADIPFIFTTNELKKEKFTEQDHFLAMFRMQKCLNNKIESELKEDYKLQSKIKDIEFKTKKRIEKLKEKPLKKLQKKYGIDRFDKYFESKLESEAES
jgi:hypothetical protein